MLTLRNKILSLLKGRYYFAVFEKRLNTLFLEHTRIIKAFPPPPRDQTKVVSGSKMLFFPICNNSKTFFCNLFLSTHNESFLQSCNLKVNMKEHVQSSAACFFILYALVWGKEHCRESRSRCCGIVLWALLQTQPVNSGKQFNLSRSFCKL